MTKKLILVTALAVFIITGFLLERSFDFFEANRSMRLAFTWCLLPSVLIAIYYSYRILLKDNGKTAKWKLALQRVALVGLITILSCMGFVGYIVYANSAFGGNNRRQVKGRIVKVDYPARKKIFNDYQITVRLEFTEELLQLHVPTDEYRVNDYFDKEMISGAFGILYSRVNINLHPK